MNREEAKIFLYSIAGDLGFTDVENYTCKDGEKMREAIEALEQEPCGDVNANQHISNALNDDGQRKNVLEDDAIRRQDVLDLLQMKYFGKELYMTIYNMPSVNPKPRTGEWQQDLDGTYLCSECGSGFKEQPTLMGKPMFLWCPLCGAKMQEVEDEI